MLIALQFPYQFFSFYLKTDLLSVNFNPTENEEFDKELFKNHDVKDYKLAFFDNLNRISLACATFLRF